MRGFGRFEFQLMLLRRMADLQPNLVEDALILLDASRTDLRLAHRRWQELMHSRRYPSDIRRFEIALGGADDVRPLPIGDVVCHAHRWSLPLLWPDLAWEVVTDGTGNVLNEWLVRAGGTASVPVTFAAIEPWTCVVGDVAAAFPEARQVDLQVPSRWGLVLDQGQELLATFVWGLVQRVQPTETL